MMKIINLTSFLIIWFLFANANAGWLDKAIEEGKKIGKEVYEKSKENIPNSDNKESQEQKNIEHESSPSDNTKLEDCPQGFANMVSCGTAKDMIGTNMSLKEGDVYIVKKGVLQCFPRGCPEFNESSQPGKQKTSQQKKADPKPSTKVSHKNSKPNQSATTVLPAQDLDESTPTGKALTTVHALLTPSGSGLGTAAQVMARIEPRGYKLKGASWNVAELLELGGGQIIFHCGLKACSPDSEVTSIDYTLKGSRSTYEIYGDLIAKSQAYMRGRLGMETSSSNITDQSADLHWEPPSKASHAKHVTMIVRQAKLQVSIRK